MASVVFLRAVNVGTANRCQPALLAKQLSKFGVVNIGAVGTFVVHERVSESTLRAAIARKLPFKCEIMICPAANIIKLVRHWTDSRWRASSNPVSRQSANSNLVRFVSVLAKPVRVPPPLPIRFPADGDWLVKIVAVEGRFVLGLYRRQMKAIGYLSQIERRFGVPATIRNWNTIQKIAALLTPANASLVPVPNTKPSR